MTDFKTPMARALGLGSAHDGVHHWWSQRMTSAALVPLTILALFPIAGAIGAPREEVLATFADPWNAVVTILFLAVMFKHLHQGLQVVIEDYVHHPGRRIAALTASTFFCGLFGVAGVFAVARIAFGAA
ncbi:succinate dehydrogenase, hydrophobic membrane anchor protein [Oceanicella actignis]|uniref:Succinate dehydrogenase hydrophobic membrane anchor subunit n=1 Tax=Oceanicella actignis TaxID=1189325 RepID=A0A1M7TAF0_9RHOB|nr:succinate dehydrogenase, hydrophobic membrane anchor protein [Oceanicella actignis]TYO89176.1 succinate dehydrogenase / fumarate reductase membrane anchor subunit [Oceanicella actignis]SET52312.1 succinate dehydrogenase / fumarate reductase membrane anchor subunit [Oceanicella actignis]SHN67691.1 succinate dehydrogenase / fumarate reductase membrane anchor subunit [Oceanicella actignis]